jgi:hypothetical protein
MEDEAVASHHAVSVANGNSDQGAAGERVSCTQAGEAAVDSFVGQLSRAGRKLLTRHLEKCPRCASRFVDVVIGLEIDRQRRTRRKQLVTMRPRTRRMQPR